jgi:hypothetical protein
MHIRKRHFQNIDPWDQVKAFWPWDVPNIEELCFKVGPSFRVKTAHFQLRTRMTVLSLKESSSWIIVEMDVFLSNK